MEQKQLPKETRILIVGLGLIGGSYAMSLHRRGYHVEAIDRSAETIEFALAHDYIDSGCLCLIEWPENIESILPEETLKVSIAVHPDESRVITWEDQ